VVLNTRQPANNSLLAHYYILTEMYISRRCAKTDQNEQKASLVITEIGSWLPYWVPQAE